MALAFTRVLTLDQVEARYGGVADPADAALASKPPAGASPQEVYAWWQGLTEQQRRRSSLPHPGRSATSTASPQRLATPRTGSRSAATSPSWAPTRTSGSISDHERDLLRNARAAQDALDRIEGGVDPVTGDPIEAQVYIYDPGAFDGDGAVAISAGDLDTADNVSVVVPGFGTDGASAGYQADRAVRLYEASRSLDTSASNATLFWIGTTRPTTCLPTASTRSA